MVTVGSAEGLRGRVTPLFRDIPAEIAWTSGTRQRGDVVRSRRGIRRPVPDVATVLRDAGQFDPRATSLALTGIPKWLPKEVDRYLDLLIELSRSAGPVVVLANEVVISERPLSAHSSTMPGDLIQNAVRPSPRRRAGRVRWHGVRVEPWLIRSPSGSPSQRSTRTRNAEVRRVMIERFGSERLIREGNAELVQEDGTGGSGAGELGRLWNVEEPIVMVEVLNSTPEPDGSRKTYFLRVPPAPGPRRGGRLDVRGARAGLPACAGDVNRPLAE